MTNVLEGMQNSLNGMMKLNAETAANLNGIDTFVRALVSELRKTNPELMQAVSQQLEALELPADASPTKIEGKRYAQILARSV